MHPRYLDRQGLTSCWREGLLAQKVLTGTTRGYRNHPQLERFRSVAPDASPGVPTDVSPEPSPGIPSAASSGVAPPDPSPDVSTTGSDAPEPQHPGAPITTYLHAVVDEATARGYAFDRTKILAPPEPGLRLELTSGQLAYEWAHLRLKLAARSPEVLRRWADVDVPSPHPLFVVVPGRVASWEVVEETPLLEG